jgi:hypothetical protein
MGVRVTRSLVLCECFVYRCLSCCPFSLRHCLVCSSTIYGFWLPLWYLQTLLMYILYLNFGFYFLNRIPLTLGCLWNISYFYISIVALFFNIYVYTYIYVLHIRIKIIHLNWLNTLHVTFTIPCYRLECWYRPVQQPCITRTTGLYTDICLSTS